jgi:hypothetical protein
MPSRKPMKRSLSLNTDIVEMCRAAATCAPLGSSLAACGGACTGTPACGLGRTGSGGAINPSSRAGIAQLTFNSRGVSKSPWISFGH